MPPIDADAEDDAETEPILQQFAIEVDNAYCAEGEDADPIIPPAQTDGDEDVVEDDAETEPIL